MCKNYADNVLKEALEVLHGRVWFWETETREVFRRAE